MDYPAFPSPSGTPAAVKEGTIDGKRLKLTLYPIRRTDTLSVLGFTISWDADPNAGSSDYLALNSALGDEDTTTGDRNTYDATDGIRLVDAKNRKRYIAASDEKGDCLCSRELSSLTVEPGDSYGFYTTFAAPPAGVTALDVTVPHFGSIPHVPVV